jgi:hypothetical protein
MTTGDSEATGRVLEEAWKASIDEKQFDASLLIAVSFYQVFRSMRNAELEVGALGLIATSVELILGPSKELGCSFCGRQPPDVKLARGKDKASICNSCASEVVQLFAK